MRDERKTQKELLEELGRVQRDLTHLRKAEAERKEVEQALKRRTHELGERVKELNCLYGIARLVERPGVLLEEVLGGVVNLIPPSWQFPEITCARIVVLGEEYKTANFRETGWKQAATIVADGRPTGSLEVFYLEERPESDEGPFLKEERKLIDAIAGRLGKIVERKRTEADLRESIELYRILSKHVADGVTLFQEGRFLFVNPAFLWMFGLKKDDEPVGRTAAEVFAGDGYQRILEAYSSADPKSLPGESFRALCTGENGREFWVEIFHNAIAWKGSPAILSTLRDVTERKLREIAIQEEAEHLRKENIRLRSSMRERYRFGSIIGRSAAMQEVYTLILRASETDANVVLYGESGTGKELVARTIHDMSERRDRPFVPVNCGAIPETLFESEFFGHKKGAFTGAHSNKRGFFDLADGGSLFLDEVSEFTIGMQVKLLRAIEGSGYMPVGGDRIRRADVRIIAASNVSLLDRVRKGQMREDFFYRLHVISIQVPPLRERKEDIPLLVENVLQGYGKDKGSKVPGNVMEALMSYPWPGNVRELQNVVHRYLTVHKLDFVGSLMDGPSAWGDTAVGEAGGEGLNLRESLERFEREVIAAALDQTRWHRGHAASLLGIDRKTLFRKMKQFGMA
ncbi:MAG: sigma 54-interacting transcriptional regulator [Deltaproteobacteria bacterium]|nr:sigma 54-interacting transcriptional regulator [Deltaproteobacteria bacterium]